MFNPLYLHFFKYINNFLNQISHVKNYWIIPKELTNKKNYIFW